MVTSKRKLSQVRLSIKTLNFAFDPTPHKELARLLRHLATTIEHGRMPRRDIVDCNGNTVGFFDTYYEKEGTPA